MTGLYSPINKLMEQVTRPKGTGAEYMAELQKKPGYKPAEAEDRDLQALMALPQMERAAFMEKLQAQANKFPLKHRELGEGQTHHDTYTLPGGENYREILLHTPDTKREELKKKLSDIGDLMNSAGTTPEQYKKLYATRAALADQYTHGVEGSFGGNAAHFGGTPNILASVRVKDRTSPEGKKILHIEEIQSDWHQQGREHGYHPKDLYAQIRAAKAEKNMMDRYLKEADEDSGDMAYGEYGRMVDDHQAATEKLDRLEQLKEEGVPHGPHAKDWHELALKAMIQHAAENGYDQIAVTPGAEQARRFGLSKHVGSVSYHPETQHFQAFKPNRETITNEKGATPERIKALIGKEAAEKLMQAPKQMGHHYLEGEDLNMGGEGMKGFYDKMVPTFLNKFGKKHGVQVQPGTVPIVSTPAQHHGITEDQFQAQSPDEQQRMVRQHAYAHQGAKTEAPVHTFDITPAMREDVLKNGIPRYADGGDVSRETAEANKAKFLKGSKVPERVYHGTGNLENLQSFDPAMTGKGTDQLGSGFYFTTDPQEASGYASGFRPSGGKESNSPGVVAAHLAIKKPLVVKGSNLNDTNVKLQHRHALALIKRAPNITHPDDSPLNDWVDTSRTGITPKVMHDVAKNYTGPSLMSLGNDFFRDDPTAFRTAIRDVLGYDGVMQDFGGGRKHYVAWFPHQIKSAIGNRGTYDTSKDDLSMAEGGAVEEDVPRETTKAYKLFRVHPKHPGKLFPLFVDSNTPVEMNKWIAAKEGEMANGKVKSKIGPLAYRPGWHAGDLPIATHIGEKSDPSLTAPDVRPEHHAWAEVEMPNDVDWQAEATKRGTNAQGKLIPVKAHITDQLPAGGHYRYKTNPNMTGNWLIGGSMKVNRVLSDKEVAKINKAAGLADLPRAQPFNAKKFGFAKGGVVAPEEWLAEEHVNHKAKGGSIKPVGHAVIKEKVTISPNMDAMQYELMGVKHFTKKAK